MAEDPIRKYSEANDELGKAKARIQKMRDTIAEVGQSLLYPYEFMISNVKVGLPIEVAMGSAKHSLNADDWPSAQQIAEALANLHEKRKHLENAWHALSESDRKIVNPLPPKQ